MYNSDDFRECGLSGYTVNYNGVVRGPRDVLHTRRRKSGYVTINATIDGRCKQIAVHRLVCYAFHGQPIAPAIFVNHKDGCRYNNHCNNLEWVTAKQNTQDRWQRTFMIETEGYLP